MSDALYQISRGQAWAGMQSGQAEGSAEAELTLAAGVTRNQALTLVQRLIGDMITFQEQSQVTAPDPDPDPTPPPPTLWRLTFPKTNPSDVVSYHQVEPFDGDPDAAGVSLASVSGLKRFAVSSGGSGGVQAINAVPWANDPSAALAAEWILWDGPPPHYLRIHRHVDATDTGLVQLHRSDDDGARWHAVDEWYVGAEWPNTSDIVAIDAETAVPVSNEVRTWRIIGTSYRGASVHSLFLYDGPTMTGNKIPGTNALGSSVFEAGHEAPLAFDSDAFTRWTSLYQDGTHWLQWDSLPFVSFNLLQYNNLFRFFNAKLQRREADGVTWTDIVAIPEAVNSVVNTGLSLAPNVLPPGLNQWRLLAPQSRPDIAQMGEHMMQIKELRLFSGANNTSPQLTVTAPLASSEYSSSWVAANAFDGDDTIAYSSARQHGQDQWLQWDSDEFGYIEVMPYYQNRITNPTFLQRRAADGTTWLDVCEIRPEHWDGVQSFKRIVP